MHIIEKYGNTLITVITVIFCFTLICGTHYTINNGTTEKGFFNALGKGLKGEEKNYGTYMDSTNLSDVVSQVSPKISYNENADLIKCNKEVQLLSYFTLVTAYGEASASEAPTQECKIEISDIVNNSNVSVLDLYDTDTGNITFNAAGIYTISFHLTDKENRQGIFKITIPVERS